ncbi:MAG: prephenate dehydrogenase/arogenate dehydrogenase family protein [Clostridia bacterium]|nr:prephenate dehydrogenase/arogenate dehydrogenase family protein [Clostridia bacterium]
MNICICGLGLIGGSLAKAVKAKTAHTVYGVDRDAAVAATALSDGAIDKIAKRNDLADCELIILALYPRAAVEFVRDHLADFRPDAILLDTCGIKREVMDGIRRATAGTSLRFIGGHPMAGIEKSGFSAAFATLFEGASMILCTEACRDERAVKTVGDLCRALGFARITISTAEHHDKVIAFTSQLAHVVSAAYIAGQYATKHAGFSAGSFRDMTRVARLNPEMWTELFFENRENLSDVIGELIENLGKFKTALDSGDAAGMHTLLKESNERKIRSENL